MYVFIFYFKNSGFLQFFANLFIHSTPFLSHLSSIEKNLFRESDNIEVNTRKMGKRHR